MRISDWSSDVCSSDLGRLALPVAADEDDPNAHIYADARARTAAFGGVEIVDLPSPGRVEIGGEIAAASYMNFYIGNTTVVVPTYGVPSDQAAVDTLAALFPDRRAVGEIGRAHVCTPVTNAHLVCRLLLEKKTLSRPKRSSN